MVDAKATSMQGRVELQAVRLAEVEVEMQVVGQFAMGGHTLQIAEESAW